MPPTRAAHEASKAILADYEKSHKELKKLKESTDKMKKDLEKKKKEAKKLKEKLRKCSGGRTSSTTKGGCGSCKK